MSRLSREQILEYAGRYINTKKADFPMEGDLFYFLNRRTVPNKVLKENEGWQFAGYALCRGYSLDEDSKPAGKWIFMYYLDLARFPLVEQALKVQPPHVALGQFQTPDRQLEIRMSKCRIFSLEEQNQMPNREKKQQQQNNIIAFPKKKN
jgi:hypothetical protein